jgi:hypothetical protein
MTPNPQNFGRRLIVAFVALAAFVSAHAQVPSTIMPPEGNVETLRCHARGYQRYVSVENPNLPGTYIWRFVAPLAILSNHGGHDFGTHFGGPTWRANNTGSSVMATRVDGLNMDPTAIDWLLLRGRDWSGHGMFSKVSYIQRINTVGGISPSWIPTSAGIEANIPYTATYVFFEASETMP